MRDYGKVSVGTWVDYKDRTWPVITSPRRLKFKYPSHAALREHVFVRDGFSCRRCDAKASAVPDGWDGSSTLTTNTLLRSGWPDVLIVDHVLTLRAGGKSVIENLQTLCETCNRRKQKTDIADARAYVAGG